MDWPSLNGATRLARSKWRRIMRAVSMLLVLLFLAGCSATGNSTAPTPLPTPTLPVTSVPATPENGAERAVCEDGRLLIGDLTAMDLAWRDGFAAATAKARDWQADARLTRARVGCQLFEPGFRWQVTFYSERTQTFYASDSTETEPSEIAPEDVPMLPVDTIDFGVLRRALIKAGFEDADVISASIGVDIRTNTKALPFGPPDSPRDVMIYHVAVERLGKTTDLFVDSRDGTVYRFASP